MDKEILEITKKFHDTYEKLASEYTYETREDTKVFDINSNNGKLMYAVVNEIVSPILKENQELKIKINNKIDDLRASNLFITTKQVQGKLTGYLTKRCKKIVYTDNAGFKHIFRSSRYAAKELGVSYQTVLDICNRKVKKPKFNLKFQEEK